MKQIKKTFFVVLLIVGIFIFFQSDLQRAFAGDFAVIVNKENTYSADKESMKKLIRSLFLKKRSEWPQTTHRSKPFLSKEGSLERKAFLRDILGLSERRLAEYWIAEKTKTGNTSPREVSANILVKMVDKYPGGFGVLTKELAQKHSDQVVILFEF